ncbi:MAG: 50S ribosomal protein L18 [candidate division Zixibacteria bacterium]|nr:50S ribosomal protein L18 [candidate division Zixibacteria bacterium]
MADKIANKQWMQHRRQLRVRKKVLGTPARPRLTVFRSTRNVYAQLIDDIAGVTLVSCSSIDKDMIETVKAAKKKSELSVLVGEGVAKKALAKGIENVVFDRNRYEYHGRIKAVADGARKAGLKF